MICQFAIRSVTVAATILLLAMPAEAQGIIKAERMPDTDEFNASNQPPAQARPKPGRRPAQPANRGANRQPANKKANNALAGPKTDIKIELPDDVTKPVLVMDSVGGFRMKLPDGFEATPMLQIFPDGRILTGRKSPLVKEVAGQLDLVDLQSLLVFVADDCRFFDISSELVKSDLDANRIGEIMDAGTTEFTVNLKNNSNTVGVYALPNAAAQFADVPSVLSMIAIASRCRRVIAMTRLGAEEEAIAALQSANKSLVAKAPEAPEYTLDNLQYAEQFEDGRRTATFVNEFDQGGKRMMVYAIYQIDAEGNDSVSLNMVEQRDLRGR